jgi:heparosan-N-sulfate-glucuronate 5-epimerase
MISGMAERGSVATGEPLRSRLRRVWQPHPGHPDLLSTARSFSPPVGQNIEPGIRGYYIDFRAKAADPGWPPQWLQPGGEQVHVAIIQWGLGCYERYLAGDGDAWLEAAIATCDHLADEQERGGAMDGGWAHRSPLKHTYRTAVPWLSAMAQGEGASLLVRVSREVNREQYLEAAVRALAPMRVPVSAGGVRAELEGEFFPEEYPTTPGSFVLNGAIFALWGCHDVAAVMDDAGAQELFEAGVAGLAANLDRFDLGYWSRYDLFPHPLANIASAAYHRLHINQLRAMSQISELPSFIQVAERFEEQEQSALNRARAFGRKVVFRLVVPRNRVVAHRLPWSRREVH